jgi:Holliday junction resolvasome RuvABC endonuclease subunit
LVKQLVVSGGDPERNLVLIENYAFGKTNQAHQMGELGGVIRLMLFEEGYEFFVIPPTRLKKFLTGKGVADKNIILKEVFKRWKFDVDDDNVADALVLMQLGLALVGKLENTTAFQEAVVQEVLKDLSKVEE